jgi:hypothetical protein
MPTDVYRACRIGRTSLQLSLDAAAPTQQPAPWGSDQSHTGPTLMPKWRNNVDAVLGREVDHVVAEPRERRTSSAQANST